MSTRINALIPIVAAVLSLAACAPRTFVVLPTPPADVRKERPTPMDGQVRRLQGMAQERPTPVAAAPEAKAAPDDAARPAGDNGAVAPPKPDYAKAYEAAVARTKDLLRKSAAKEAIPLWRELESSPWGLDAVFHQGVLLQLAGDLDGASAQYRRVVENGPLFEPAAANLLGIYLLRGEKENVRSLLDRVAPAGSPAPAGMLPELSTNVVAALVETGDHERASLLVLALRAQGVRTPALAWNTAVLAYRQGNAETARKLAGEIPPEVANLWPVVASRFAWERESVNVPALDNAVGTDPRMAALSQNLSAFAELRAGAREPARRRLAAGVGGGSYVSEFRTNLGTVLADLGEWKEARENLEQAVRDAPAMAEGWLNLGVFREVYEGNPAGALECYRNYVNLNGSRKDEVRKWIEWLQKPAPPSQ